MTSLLVSKAIQGIETRLKPYYYVPILRYAFGYILFKISLKQNILYKVTKTIPSKNGYTRSTSRTTAVQTKFSKLMYSVLSQL